MLGRVRLCENGRYIPNATGTTRSLMTNEPSLTSPSTGGESNSPPKCYSRAPKKRRRREANDPNRIKWDP
eukprot:3826978-Pyramimonas_sp.AAC.1